MKFRHRYSWTHWLGVGLQVFIVVQLFLQPWFGRLLSYLQLRGWF